MLRAEAVSLSRQRRRALVSRSDRCRRERLGHEARHPRPVRRQPRRRHRILLRRPVLHGHRAPLAGHAGRDRAAEPRAARGAGRANPGGDEQPVRARRRGRQRQRIRARPRHLALGEGVPRRLGRPSRDLRGDVEALPTIPTRNRGLGATRTNRTTSANLVHLGQAEQGDGVG